MGCWGKWIGSWRGGDWLAGDEVSVADLLGYCEVVNLVMSRYELGGMGGWLGG